MGEHGHGPFGEVTAFADLPFVVGLDQDRPQGVGKVPNWAMNWLVCDTPM